MANTTLKFGNGEWYGKKDTILAYNDLNSNYKPLPFDFSRDGLATVINKDGLIETVGSGEPRIDYKDNTKGALLLEPSRTNLVLTSASGDYGNPPASETNTISPDGTNNAVIPTPNELADRYQYSISGSTYATDTKLVYSWYRKRISTPIIDSSLGDLQFNNLVNATKVGSTTQIQSNINGFDRFQAIINITDGSASSIIRAYFGGVVGIGNSSVAYFGHQLEVGSYPTSYIPTQGGVVTRLADSCSQTVPDGVIGQTEGTVFLDTVINTDVNGLTRISLSQDVSTSNWIFFSAPEVSGGLVRTRIFINNGGNLQVNLYGGVLTSGRHKFALAYKENDVVLYVDGVLDLSDNSALIPSTNKISLIGSSPASDNADRFNKHNEVKLYNTRLSNSELQALTTI